MLQPHTAGVPPCTCRADKQPIHNGHRVIDVGGCACPRSSAQLGQPERLGVAAQWLVSPLTTGWHGGVHAPVREVQGALQGALLSAQLLGQGLGGTKLLWATMLREPRSRFLSEFYESYNGWEVVFGTPPHRATPCSAELPESHSELLRSARALSLRQDAVRHDVNIDRLGVAKYNQLFPWWLNCTNNMAANRQTRALSYSSSLAAERRMRSLAPEACAPTATTSTARTAAAATSWPRWPGYGTAGLAPLAGGGRGLPTPWLPRAAWWPGYHLTPWAPPVPWHGKATALTALQPAAYDDYAAVSWGAVAAEHGGTTAAAPVPPRTAATSGITTRNLAMTSVTEDDCHRAIAARTLQQFTFVGLNERRCESEALLLAQLGLRMLPNAGEAVSSARVGEGAHLASDEAELTYEKLEPHQQHLVDARNANDAALLETAQELFEARLKAFGVNPPTDADCQTLRAFSSVKYSD